MGLLQHRLTAENDRSPSGADMAARRHSGRRIHFSWLRSHGRYDKGETTISTDPSFPCLVFTVLRGGSQNIDCLHTHRKVNRYASLAFLIELLFHRYWLRLQSPWQQLCPVPDQSRLWHAIQSISRPWRPWRRFAK
jgi:hypothetical protein